MKTRSVEHFENEDRSTISIELTQFERARKRVANVNVPIKKKLKA